MHACRPLPQGLQYGGWLSVRALRGGIRGSCAAFALAGACPAAVGRDAPGKGEAMIGLRFATHI